MRAVLLLNVQIYKGKRERSPNTKKLCVRVSHFGEIAGVNLRSVQCEGLALEHPSA